MCIHRYGRNFGRVVDYSDRLALFPERFLYSFTRRFHLIWVLQFPPAHLQLHYRNSCCVIYLSFDRQKQILRDNRFWNVVHLSDEWFWNMLVDGYYCCNIYATCIRRLFHSPSGRVLPLRAALLSVGKACIWYSILIMDGRKIRIGRNSRFQNGYT